MMQRFHRNDDAYAGWIGSHPTALVVNEETMTLHQAGCSYVTFIDARWKTTNTPKLCFEDAGSLRFWAGDEGIALRSCRDCKMDPPVVARK